MTAAADMLHKVLGKIDYSLSGLPVAGPCQQSSAAALGLARAQHMQLSEHTCKKTYISVQATLSGTPAEDMHHNSVFSHFVVPVESQTQMQAQDDCCPVQ